MQVYPLPHRRGAETPCETTHAAATCQERPSRGQPTAVPPWPGTPAPGCGLSPGPPAPGVMRPLSPLPRPPPGPGGLLARTERSARPAPWRARARAPVVILLRRERHAVQRVMGVQPLLLLQGQALQLSRLRVHGLELMRRRHGRGEGARQVPVGRSCSQRRNRE